LNLKKKEGEKSEKVLSCFNPGYFVLCLSYQYLGYTKIPIENSGYFQILFE